MSASLGQPVGALMRATSVISPEDSLEVAAALMRDDGLSVLPITNGPYLYGVLTERTLLRALAQGFDPRSPVVEAIEAPTVIMPYMTGAEALRRLEKAVHDTLIVVDDQGRVMGVLTPSDLFPKREPAVRPQTIGGMATPFGVYLTTGSVRAGASDLALVTTGMSLFALFFGANALALWIAETLVSRGVPERTGSILLDIFAMAFFLIGMRALPLAGIHAAEHQVVHAIERGEDLVPEIVKRMPRVHPRCGTNLAMGATLFLGVFSFEQISDPQLRLLLAMVVTISFWRPLGSLAQYWVTTRPPTDKHIALGIKSGQELLKKHAETHSMSPSPWSRLWNSGMFHVMAGSSIAYGIVSGVATLFHIPLPL